MHIFYFILTLLVCSLGAISGLGGGLIIKPILDLIGYHDMASTAFYSSLAVLSMAAAATVHQWRSGVDTKWKDAGIFALGSTLGGVVGELILQRFLGEFAQTATATFVTSGLMIVTLVLVLLSKRLDYRGQLSGAAPLVLAGIISGGIAVFLGIGGGPINIALLVVLFSLPIKTAISYSIVSVFCSQIAKMVTIAGSTGFSQFDLSFALLIIPAAVIGGIIGSKLKMSFSDTAVSRTFTIVMLITIALNAVLLIRALL
jgi:uncharacterized membrane protein YfcA